MTFVSDSNSKENKFLNWPQKLNIYICHFNHHKRHNVYILASGAIRSIGSVTLTRAAVLLVIWLRMYVSIGHRLEPINSYILDGHPSVL